MTEKEAINMLIRLQHPEPYEPQLNEAAFEALQIGIDAISMLDSQKKSCKKSGKDIRGRFVENGWHLEVTGAHFINDSNEPFDLESVDIRGMDYKGGYFGMRLWARYFESERI